MPKTVVVTGPESTGKSEMSRFLSKEFGSELVPEIAREFLNRLGRPYVEEDLHTMADKQLEAQLEKERETTSLLICDTDLLTFIIWWEVKYGNCPEVWVDRWKEHQPDLYLLMDIDLPWEMDPLREHPDRRSELRDCYVEKLQSVDTQFKIISGRDRDRFDHAKQTMEEFLLP